VADPDKRLTGIEAIKHPWFKMVQQFNDDVKISQEVIQRLRSFKGVSQFKKAAMNILVKTIKPEEVASLR
jgi:hypothetical protein